MVYDKDGTLLSSVYDAEGNALSFAYDAEGSIVYTKEFSLKVMTYNIGGWYIGSGTNVPTAQKAEYLALQTGMLEDDDPDILFIEEYLANFSADGTSALTILQGLFPYVHVKTSGTYYGRAICSKYPITNYVERYYTNETSRYYDSCTITVEGKPITCIVTHLSANNPDNRIAQATELCNFVKTLSGDFIIGGDFNSNLFYPFSEVNTAVYQQFLDYGCTIANDGAFGILNTACNSTDWANDAFAIDNIICSSGIEIQSVSTDLTKTTDEINDKIDHIPLIAELLISA